MIFNDGAATDQHGFLLVCPKCGSEEFSWKTRECSVCGEKRQNYCIPDDKNAQQHVNAPNARYCEACGAKTLLYHYKKLLPWQDAKDMLRVNPALKLSESTYNLPF